MENNLAGVWIVVIIVQVIFAVLTANIASKKGERFGIWFLAGLSSSVIAFIYALMIENKYATYESAELDSSDSQPRQTQIKMPELIDCPLCSKTFDMKTKLEVQKPKITYTNEELASVFDNLNDTEKQEALTLRRIYGQRLYEDHLKAKAK